MGFFDDLTGKTAADAARAAAADTYKKQQEASAGTRTAGDDYLSKLLGLSGNYAPWQATGQTANDAVMSLIRDPSSVRSLPGYQFGLDQGVKSLDRSALANGSLNSGKTAKAIENYGVNYADKTYGDQLARLLGVSQQGLNATGAATSTAGQGYQGQLGARTSSYGQDFNSATTIGQGDIAAANARTQGTQNLFNTGASLLGMGFGGGGGGSLLKGAGNAFGSLMAPKGGYTGWTGGG